ncbi:hypothetical protein KJS94_05465 [Flavihumibacter rivuli]|uniref:hypothetical protein n=1 Tax=Flavihumibacter rivuli TaxID=2838156 RepID=UPI001BDDEA0D|nr:hypothetical protein [Flavihumibacter rivuli]ULQ57648.1 hypothetical protein KJS94_05465 [Flavihumibacter rivuli]
MRFSLVICLLLPALMGAAQDLTGIWRGHFRSHNRMLQMMNVEDRYKFEVQVDQRGKEFKGVTYSYKTTEFYGKATAKGTVNPKTQKVLLDEIKIVEVRMSRGSDACIMTCFLQYSRNGNEEFLEGTYVSMNTADSTDCGRGTVFLRKVDQSDFYKEPFLVAREKEKKKAPVAAAKPKAPVTTNPVPKPADPKPATAKSGTTKNTNPPTASVNKPKQPTISEPAPPPSPKPAPQAKLNDAVKSEIKKPAISVPPPPDIRNRQNEVVKTFSVSSREITVSLYDNGTIDKDTVSVYLNNKLVVSKRMLSLSPITVQLTLDEENDYQELVMVAENLGEIPPNTSLMVVKAGDKQYEARITSTEQKNAVVVFKYEKPR